MMKSIALGTALLAASGAAGAGCGSDDNTGPLGNVDALIVLQRPKRNDMGDIFQYSSYKPGARLVKLEPPTADGTLTTICCANVPGFENADISGYDISFDAKEIVFSAKLADNQAYGLFVLQLATGEVEQLPTDAARDYVMPIFLPGDKIMFVSNSVVEQGAKQHRDEYERGTTTQLGRINRDGTGEELGPRNLSHRTFPTLASDGRVMFTQWDHLGRENSGHLMFVNQDMQELREGFGKEGTGASNSTLKAQEVSPGRFVAIATARNRTIQAGALIDIRLGTVTTDKKGNVAAQEAQSEATATYRDLSPDVPRDNSPSAETVGRYYDAYPLDAKDKPDLIVSWADGPVESGVLGAANLEANFGVYLYDTERQQRHPILDNLEMWDVFPRPLKTRTAPPVVASATDTNLGGQLMVGSMNAYQSSLHTFAPGEVYGVRVMEGFSSEEGFPQRFGTTMFEGQANLGVARLSPDGSWLATVPANVPLHLQSVDVFGMSLFTEPVWFSGRPNETRVCGGCHENRTATTVINPGLTQAFAVGPTAMYGTTARTARLSATNHTRDKVMGIAWDTVLQPMFDAKCVSCHGDSNTAGIAPYTITDPVTGSSVMWTFNLSGGPLPAALAEAAGGGQYSKSYFSMAGPDMEAVEKGGLMITGNLKVYLNPEDSRGSLAIKMLNPTQQFPTQNASVRAFSTTPHMQTVGGTDLTPDEFYQLILSADMGANFYARENNPGLSTY